MGSNFRAGVLPLSPAIRRPQVAVIERRQGQLLALAKFFLPQNDKELKNK